MPPVWTAGIDLVSFCLCLTSQHDVDCSRALATVRPDSQLGHDSVIEQLTPREWRRVICSLAEPHLTERTSCSRSVLGTGVGRRCKTETVLMEPVLQ